MNADGRTPESRERRNRQGSSNSSNLLSIINLYYHASDISELRKLAEVDPKLAERLVDQRDLESARVTSSYNFAVLMSASLTSIVIVSFTLLTIFGDILKAAVVIAAVLAAAVLVRVILTGEWSETSWFGRLMEMFVRLLGGKLHR